MSNDWFDLKLHAIFLIYFYFAILFDKGEKFLTNRGVVSTLVGDKTNESFFTTRRNGGPSVGVIRKCMPAKMKEQNEKKLLVDL